MKGRYGIEGGWSGVVRGGRGSEGEGRRGKGMAGEGLGGRDRKEVVGGGMWWCWVVGGARVGHGWEGPVRGSREREWVARKGGCV